jgi:branched-chain amino acid transport system ATP-binding protein
LSRDSAASGKDTGILRLDGLQKFFGGLEAVSAFSLRLGEGELKGLIGPNGAGKSTVFNLISGQYKPNQGRVLLEGEDITGRRPDIIVGKGIARTFQAVKMLANGTVLDTMLTAYFLTCRYSALDAALQTRRYRQTEEKLRDAAVGHLSRLGIEHLKDAYCNELPYGLQRKASIASTLCLNPKVLLLDEPMAGLTRPEKEELSETILKIKAEFNLSIILVEHDMKVIMNLCDAIAVMNNGRMIAAGDAEAIRTNPDVIKAYLGKEDR